MIDIAQVRAQVRLEADDTSEDALLTLYLGAAKRAIESHTNRTLYNAVEDVPAEGDDSALVINEDIDLAMLLIIGHWYANREAVSGTQKLSVPLGFEYLIEPYRHINI